MPYLQKNLFIKKNIKIREFNGFLPRLWIRKKQNKTFL